MSKVNLPQNASTHSKSKLTPVITVLSLNIHSLKKKEKRTNSLSNIYVYGVKTYT